MVSLDMLAVRAAISAARSRGFALGSGSPVRAAVVSSRISFVKALARFASCAPLRYMMFLNWEWPAIDRDLESAAGPGHSRNGGRGRAAVIDKAPIWQELGAFYRDSALLPRTSHYFARALVRPRSFRAEAPAPVCRPGESVA